VTKIETIKVRVFKYDGVQHRQWPATILRQEGTLVVLDAKFEEETQHDFLGTIALGTTSVEYYWLDRWYNVFRFSDPGGTLRNYYCNINVPPTFDGQVLSYIDLDIDILVDTDFSFRVLDLEEFEQNAARYGYPKDVRLNAKRALRELIALIESRHFPFDR
jgi:protein associated with RNAse G/E